MRSRSVELVAELLDGLDRVGEERQLLAQPADVHVDRARAAGVLVAPDVAEQQIARQHAAAMLHQVLQQQELLGREPDFLAVERDLMAIGVDGDRAVAQRARSPVPRPARRSSAATRASALSG